VLAQSMPVTACPAPGPSPIPDTTPMARLSNNPRIRHDLILFENGAGDALTGVDEAGRGAWAGPVVAGAVLLEPPFYHDRKRRSQCRRIDDSKKLTPDARDAVFAQIGEWAQGGLLTFAAGAATIHEVEAHNVHGATRIAMTRAIEGILAARAEVLPHPPDDTPLLPPHPPASPNPAPRLRTRLLIDGKPCRPFPWAHQAIIGGDALSLAIAMGSIVAKVTRDRHMTTLHALHPGYGFASHKGYGTSAHRQAIQDLGPCREHRTAFLRNLNRRQPAPAAQDEIAV